MKLLLLIAGAIISVVLAVLALAARSAERGPAELRHRKLDEFVSVDLQGVGRASLPPAFKFDGIVSSGPNRCPGPRTTTLANHLDDQQLSLRFTQGQFVRANGQPASPVVLAITLFAPSVRTELIAHVDETPIWEFESPSDTRRFQNLNWHATPGAGGTATHVAAVPDASDARTARWLVIHTDAARRVRVDLYVWQRAYTAEEAGRLVRSVAASVSTTPALQQHFANASTFDQRAQARRREALAKAANQLAPAGIHALQPGEVELGRSTIAGLSGSGRFLAVGRYLGSVPIPPGARDARGRPIYTFRHTHADFQGHGIIDGHPDLQLRLFYWDVAAREWRVAGLQGALFEPFAAGRDLTSPAIVETLQARGAGAHDHGHIWDFAFYDVELRPEEADIGAFLARADAYANALAAGRIIQSVKAVRGAFEWARRTALPLSTP